MTLAIGRRRVAAAHKNSIVHGLPIQSGRLKVSGETSDGPRPSDSFDVFLDDAGDLVLVMLDLQVTAESSHALLRSMMSDMRVVLDAHGPLHLVVHELELQLAARPGVEAGLIILRISQNEAKVELLNAGMPPLANALSGGQLSLHPPLSTPVGRRYGEVHPYELVPLIWGSTWLAVSDGVTSGSLDVANMSELCSNLELERDGAKLATMSPDTLSEAVRGASPSARSARDAATCVVVAAGVASAEDPERRFQSGLESR